MRFVFLSCLVFLGALVWWSLKTPLPPARLSPPATISAAPRAPVGDEGEPRIAAPRSLQRSPQRSAQGALPADLPRAASTPRSLSGAALLPHQLIPLDLLPEERIVSAEPADGPPLRLERERLLSSLDRISGRLRRDLPLPIIEAQDLFPESFYRGVGVGPRARVVRLGDGLLDEPEQLNRLLDELRMGGNNYLGVSLLNSEGEQIRVYPEIPSRAEEERR